jgi:hypothetical protein
MDGDGKYAKPLEDPQTAYDRRHARAGAAESPAAEKPALTLNRPAVASDVPPCPKCGGRMWDNRLGKRNPKAPDFKCRDRSCDGVIWPPKPGQKAAAAEGATEEAPAPVAEPATDEIPF